MQHTPSLPPSFYSGDLSTSMQTDFGPNVGTHGHSCTSSQSPTRTRYSDLEGCRGRPPWPSSAPAGPSERQTSHPLIRNGILSQFLHKREWVCQRRGLLPPSLTAFHKIQHPSTILPKQHNTGTERFSTVLLTCIGVALAVPYRPTEHKHSRASEVAAGSMFCFSRYDFSGEKSPTESLHAPVLLPPPSEM